VRHAYVDYTAGASHQHLRILGIVGAVLASGFLGWAAWGMRRLWVETLPRLIGSTTVHGRVVAIRPNSKTKKSLPQPVIRFEAAGQVVEFMDRMTPKEWHPGQSALVRYHPRWPSVTATVTSRREVARALIVGVCILAFFAAFIALGIAVATWN
jgi:streptogramin lyase